MATVLAWTENKFNATKGKQRELMWPSFSDQKASREYNIPIFTIGPAGTINKFGPEDQGGYGAGKMILTREKNYLPRDKNDLLNVENLNIVDH